MKTSTATAILALISTSIAASIPFRPKFVEDGKPRARGGYSLRNTTTHHHVQSLAAQDDVKCFTAYSEIGDWYLTFAGGPYGTNSITINGNGDTICVPYDDGVGGAMYIGGYGLPNDKSTKFETFFPHSGQAYLDVSVVDGYSISMKCEVDQLSGPLGVLGGDIDLWQTGTPCPDKQGANCLNHHAYDGSPDAVDQFFQNAHGNGNDYCIWQSCDIPNFPVQNALTCTVSGSRV